MLHQHMTAVERQSCSPQTRTATYAIVAHRDHHRSFFFLRSITIGVGGVQKTWHRRTRHPCFAASVPCFEIRTPAAAGSSSLPANVRRHRLGNMRGRASAKAGAYGARMWFCSLVVLGSKATAMHVQGGSFVLGRPREPPCPSWICSCSACS
jgi:hypothetical protein